MRAEPAVLEVKLKYRFTNQELMRRATYFDSGTIDVRALPSGTVIVAGRDDAPLFALASAGQLRVLKVIREPGDVPQFTILIR